MSKIDRIEYESKEFLVSNLRKVKLVGINELPYYEAEIKIESIPIELIYPSAFYVLQDNMIRVKQMYDDLLREGIDIFNLEGIVKSNDFIIAPPILELYEDKLTIVDGQHRVFIARAMGLSHINVVVVWNVSVPLPVTPLNWDDVKLETEVPQVKRIYNPQIELGKHSLYYRDFPSFGSSGERKIDLEG